MIDEDTIILRGETVYWVSTYGEGKFYAGVVLEGEHSELSAVVLHENGGVSVVACRTLYNSFPEAVEAAKKMVRREMVSLHETLTSLESPNLTQPSLTPDQQRVADQLTAERAASSCTGGEDARSFDLDDQGGPYMGQDGPESS